MKKWREPYESNLILDGILLFMLIVQLTTTSVSFGVPVNLTFVICLSISVLFIFLVNYMDKLRCKFGAGIRTPWTLSRKNIPQDLLLGIDRMGIYINPPLMTFAA
jgi:hypothetical protein